MPLLREAAITAVTFNRAALAKADRAHNAGVVRMDGPLACHCVTLRKRDCTVVSDRLPARSLHWWVRIAHLCSRNPRYAVA
jgi:hypothetical protein